MFGVQVVVIQLFPKLAGEAVQAETPVGPVVIGAGQVVVIQPFPDAAAAAAQVATGTFVVTTGAGQVVVM